MKKFISVFTIIMTAIQSIILISYFKVILPCYPVNLVDIVWVGSALLAAISGFLFFMLNKEIKLPISTVISVALFGIIGFPYMLYKQWIIVLLLIIVSIVLHFYMHRNSRFTILPVISSIMGIYSLGLYFLTNGIGSM